MEDEGKAPVDEVEIVADTRVVVSAKDDHGWDLDEADLQSVGGTDFHGKGDVAVDGERHGVHELGRVRDQSEEGNTQELFVNSRTVQNNVDDIDENLGNDGVKHSAGEQHGKRSPA